MFKVSFKDKPNDPSKYVVRVGNRIVVVLKGTVALPDFFKHIPEEIITWITDEQKLIWGEEDIANNIFHLKTKGISICHENDTFDYVLGERIAESRAKMRIYKFFYELTSKLFDYYSELLFGTEIPTEKGSNGSIERTASKYQELCVREHEHLEKLLASKDNG